jgi:hypothetical protein
MHFDGNAWNAIPAKQVSAKLDAIWPGGPDQLWAVGDGGTIVRYR